MAGAAPAASRTLAVKFVTTLLVRHWTSGLAVPDPLQRLGGVGGQFGGDAARHATSLR